MLANSLKASIIVLCYNNLSSCTKPCVDSILKNTNKESYELILVDNASSDGTSDYLHELKGLHPEVIIHLNSLNRGYAAGNNDGAKLAKGEFLIFLNNDTLVTCGWLETLLAPFQSVSEVGLIGPISNSVGNEQQVDLDGLNINNYQEVSSPYLNRHKGVLTPTKRLGFFCVAIPRGLFFQLDGFDEKFGIGMFEDDDLCHRVLSAGKSIMVAEDCFVFHKGSASFKKLKDQEYRNIFNQNLRYFESKNKSRWSYANISLAYFKRLLHEIEINKQNSDIQDNSLPMERLLVRLNGFEKSLERCKVFEEFLRDEAEAANREITQTKWGYRWKIVRQGLSSGTIKERSSFVYKLFLKLCNKN